CLHALLGLRRSQDQRDRRHAELGRVLLLPALRLRMTAMPELATEESPPAGKPAAPLAVSGLTISVRGEEGEREVDSDLSFTQARGETLCIAGDSGSGKSTTSLASMGLLPQPAACVSGGSIRLDGTDLAALPESRMRYFRGDRIAMIFQEPMTSLNPVL